MGYGTKRNLTRRVLRGGLAIPLLALGACQVDSAGSAPKAVSTRTPEAPRQVLARPDRPGRAPLGPLEQTSQTLYLATEAGRLTLTAVANSPSLYALGDELMLVCDGDGVVSRASWNEDITLQNPTGPTAVLCADGEISGPEARKWAATHPTDIPRLFDGRMAEGGAHLEVIDTGASQ